MSDSDLKLLWRLERFALFFSRYWTVNTWRWLWTANFWWLGYGSLACLCALHTFLFFFSPQQAFTKALWSLNELFFLFFLFEIAAALLVVMQEHWSWAAFPLQILDKSWFKRWIAKRWRSVAQVVRFELIEKSVSLLISIDYNKYWNDSIYWRKAKLSETFSG